MGLDGLLNQNLLIGWPSSSKHLKKALKVSKGLFSFFSQLKAKKKLTNFHPQQYYHCMWSVTSVKALESVWQRGFVCSVLEHKSVNPDRLKRALDNGTNVQITDFRVFSPNSRTEQININNRKSMRNLSQAKLRSNEFTFSGFQKGLRAKSYKETK